MGSKCLGDLERINTIARTGNIRQELSLGMDKDNSMDRTYQELKLGMDKDNSMDRTYQTGTETWKRIKTIAWTGLIRHEMKLGMDKDNSMDRTYQTETETWNG